MCSMFPRICLFGPQIRGEYFTGGVEAVAVLFSLQLLDCL